MKRLFASKPGQLLPMVVWFLVLLTVTVAFAEWRKYPGGATLTTGSTDNANFCYTLTDTIFGDSTGVDTVLYSIPGGTRIVEVYVTPDTVAGSTNPKDSLRLQVVEFPDVSSCSAVTWNTRYLYLTSDYAPSSGSGGTNLNPWTPDKQYLAKEDATTTYSPPGLGAIGLILSSGVSDTVIYILRVKLIGDI